MIQVYLQRLSVDMKLTLADVAFVLKVRIEDLSAFGILLDLLAFDPEYHDAIGEEQAVVEHVKFFPLNLLDIAVELM